METTVLPDVLRYHDIEALRLTRHRLDGLIEAGEYERIAPGTFLRTDGVDDTTAAWIAIATKKPDATLCLLTALSVHDLTDEIPRKSDIAIPRGTHTMTVSRAHITWHRFAVDTFAIGRTELPLSAGVSIGVYSAERTIIDMFRLRHNWGGDIAVGALKRWLSNQENSPSALLSLARDFPDAKPALQNALEILL
ncbi:MAG: hypothetical protein JWQ19_2569 [Subtercola sp.]|nr:hypothetical protein [Subtercola sp.]